jgi:hypothetical protein
MQLQPVLQSFHDFLPLFKHNCSSMALMAGPCKKTVFPSHFLPKSNSYSKGNHNSHPHPQKVWWCFVCKIHWLLRHLLKVCNHLSSYILRIGTNSVICNPWSAKTTRLGFIILGSKVWNTIPICLWALLKFLMNLLVWFLIDFML